MRHTVQLFVRGADGGTQRHTVDRAGLACADETRRQSRHCGMMMWKSGTRGPKQQKTTAAGKGTAAGAAASYAQRQKDKMSDKTFNEAGYADRKHFIKCCECGEWIDCRSLEEVFKHTQTTKSDLTSSMPDHGEFRKPNDLSEGSDEG